LKLIQQPQWSFLYVLYLRYVIWRTVRRQEVGSKKNSLLQKVSIFATHKRTHTHMHATCTRTLTCRAHSLTRARAHTHARTRTHICTHTRTQSCTLIFTTLHTAHKLIMSLHNCERAHILYIPLLKCLQYRGVHSSSNGRLPKKCRACTTCYKDFLVPSPLLR
jgi:hypothetical protein